MNSTSAWADDPISPLVAAIQDGIDVERNFERLHAHFHSRLLAYFALRRIEPAVCEELAQEVFVRVFRNLHTFERRSRFARWLFEIAHNLFLNELRRRDTAKRDGLALPLCEEGDGPDGEAPPGVFLESTLPSPFDDAAHHEQLATLRAALATLPPQMRRCVLLRLYHGLKYREVAQVLGVSLDTVKAHLGQAKVRLLRQLTDGAELWTGLTEEPAEAQPRGPV